MSGLRPEFQARADELARAYGPVLGYQRASLGAERLAGFVQAHGEVNAQLLFLVMSVHTAPMADWSKDALETVREDARDFLAASARLAKLVEQLVDRWEAQRQETSS